MVLQKCFFIHKAKGVLKIFSFVKQFSMSKKYYLSMSGSSLWVLRESSNKKIPGRVKPIYRIEV